MGEIQTPRRLLVLHVAGKNCALPLEEVEEIVPMTLVSQPPGLPPILEGFLNLKGMAVPVLRLDRLFQLPEQPPGLYTPLVILRGSKYPLALLVDSIGGVHSMPEEAFLPVREQHAFNDCVDAEVTVEDRVIHLLCPKRLLLEQERRRLAELQAMVQERLRNIEEKSS